MSLQDIGIIIGIASGLTAIITLYLTRQKDRHENVARMARIEVKVDTLWDFLMRRAVGEAVEKNIATFNSPVVISEEAKRWMASMAEQLRGFYAKLGRHLGDRDLAIEIERHFGDQILKEVCIPNGLSQGACLLIAIEVAKEINDGKQQPVAENGMIK